MTSLSKLICGSHTQLAVSWWGDYRRDRLCHLYGPPWNSDCSCEAPEFPCSSPTLVLTVVIDYSCTAPKTTESSRQTNGAAKNHLWLPPWWGHSRQQSLGSARIASGSTVAFQLGEILSGSPMVAFQSTALPACLREKKGNRFLQEAGRV